MQSGQAHSQVLRLGQDGGDVRRISVTGRAIRIVALENTRELASQFFPQLENEGRRQMTAYRELTDAQMFTEQWVRVAIDPQELPGARGDRIVCRAAAKA